jgi:hypothetical protein
MRQTLLLAAALVLGTSSVQAQNAPAGHDEAIAAIRKLGGEVKVDAQQPGAPVSVVLAGVPRPTECLPYLARINNLHACDL